MEKQEEARKKTSNLFWMFVSRFVEVEKERSETTEGRIYWREFEALWHAPETVKKTFATTQDLSNWIKENQAKKVFGARSRVYQLPRGDFHLKLIAILEGTEPSKTEKEQVTNTGAKP
jgi:hypothetical protein